MSEDANATILRLQATIENLQKDLRAMRIGREDDDLKWRTLWEKEKRRADEAEAKLRTKRAIADGPPSTCAHGVALRTKCMTCISRGSLRGN